MATKRGPGNDTQTGSKKRAAQEQGPENGHDFFHKGVKPDSLASPLCQKNGAQKTVIKNCRFQKKRTGPKDGPQTSAACNKNCQLTNRQLTPREKPSDASQIKNHSLIGRSSTEYSNHQDDGSKTNEKQQV